MLTKPAVREQPLIPVQEVFGVDCVEKAGGAAAFLVPTKIEGPTYSSWKQDQCHRATSFQEQGTN